MATPARRRIKASENGECDSTPSSHPLHTLFAPSSHPLHPRLCRRIKVNGNGECVARKRVFAVGCSDKYAALIANIQVSFFTGVYYSTTPLLDYQNTVKHIFAVGCSDKYAALIANIQV